MKEVIIMSETNTQRTIYTPTSWKTGAAITAGDLNKIENQLGFLSEEVNNAINNIIYSSTSDSSEHIHGSGDQLSERINNVDGIIVNSNTQPPQPNNKIWIKNSDSIDQIVVPTMSDLNDFENTVVNVVGNIAEVKDNYAQFSDGWINTSESIGTNINLVSPWRHAIINCNVGQNYYIQGAGGAKARLWRFVDKNNMPIDDFDEESDDSKYNKGSNDFTYYAGKRIVPSGAVKLIINDKSGTGTAYRVQGENKFPQLELNMQQIQENIQHINNTMNIYSKEMQQVPGHLFINTSGQLKLLGAGWKDRLICIKGEPNTTYVIKKDTETEMRIGCGVSNNLTVDAQLFPYTMHSQLSSEPLQITTGKDNIYIYIHLFSGNITDTSIEEQIQNLTIIKKNKSFNILLVGNSYTIDEFAYVPPLLKELMPDLAFNFCMLYRSAASLSQHVLGITDEENTKYACYEYNHFNDHWKATTNVKLSTIINKYPYDIVVFTEKSAITSFNTSKSYLQTLINSYSALLNHPVNFFWHLSHVRSTQNNYQQKIAMARAALAESGIYDIFVSGTAIENACTIAALDSLGDAGHMRADSTQHLQNGLPRLIAAYANVLKICELIGSKKTGIYSSKIKPTDSWITGQAIPQLENIGKTCVNIENEEVNYYLLGMKCALAAIKNPLNITDCSDTAIIDYTTTDEKINEISMTTKNIFNPAIFLNISGITLDANGYWTGTAQAFSSAFNNGVPGLVFEAGKQYYIKMTGYTDANTSDAAVTGLQINFYSGDTRIGRKNFLNSITTPTEIELFSTAGNDVTKLVINYSYTPSNIWHIKDIILTASTVQVAYIPYKTATDFIARENIKNSIYIEDISNLLTADGYINLQTMNVDDTIQTLEPVSNVNIKYILTDVSAGDAFILTTKGASASRPYAFIDLNNKITNISTGVLEMTNQAIIAPTDGKMIINSLNSGDFKLQKIINIQTIERLLESYYIQKDRKSHKWYGKKIVTFGDSRTSYDKTFYSNKTKPDIAGNICIGYQEQMRNLMMVTIKNQGKSGDTSAKICARVRAFDFTSYDAVLLEGGVNDFVKSSSVTIGEIQPIGGTFDDTTVYGAWQAAIEYILTNYPATQIYLTIPAIAWTGAGVFPYSIAKIKGEIAELYNLPCIDLYKNGGINEINRDNWYCDDLDLTEWRLHFNDAGNALIGAKIAEFMIAN